MSLRVSLLLCSFTRIGVFGVLINVGYLVSGSSSFEQY